MVLPVADGITKKDIKVKFLRTRVEFEVGVDSQVEGTLENSIDPVCAAFQCLKINRL